MWLRASMQLKRIDTKREPGAEFRWRVCRGLLLVAATLGSCKNAVAQNYLTQIGAPTFTTSQSVELGFVNLSNGNLHLAVPIGRFPQRGARPFIAELIYDSRIWQVVSGTSNSWQPTNAGSQGGWRFVTSADVGQMNLQGGGSRTGSWVGPATWTDPVGTARTFPVSLTTSPCAVATSGAYAIDASGYYMNLSITSCVNGAQLSWTAYAPDGTLVNSIVSGNHAPEDTNGNYFSKDANGNVIDTLGHTPVTYVANGTGCSTNYCYNILNSQGTTSQIKVTTTTVNVNTAFGQSGVTEYSGSFTAIQSITLPDGNSYTFGYDSGTTSGHYGGLTSITLPTGGQITYGYTNYQDSFGNKNLWVNSRVAGNGTWSYTPAVISTCASGTVGCKQQVTVTKPSGDNELYIFTLNNGAWKSTGYSYTGAALAANLISTVAQGWDFSQSCTPTPCTGASNIRVLTTTTTLPTPGGNNITNQTQFTYADSNTSNLASIKAWKFYAGSSPTFPATPDRETDITYHAVFGNNITNRVTQTTIKDSTGAIAAQTNFTYDDSGSLLNSTPATGIFQHDDTNYGLSNTVRGLLTTAKRCTNLSACSSNYVQTAMTYDTTGQVLSVTDPNSNVTNFTYTDTGFYNDVGDGPSHAPQPATVTAHTNAYVKTVTPPVIPATTFGYYYGTGQPALVTDPNNQTTYSHFFDSFNRPTSVVLPNGGWSYTAYSTTETQVDTFNGITAAFSTSAGSGIRQDEALLDNLGRVTTQKLMSDPEGITTVTTNYDTTGRVLNASHPYRSTNDPTYGLETPLYDGMNRTTKVTHPDTTYSQTLFGAAVSGTGVNTTQLCTPTTTYGLGYPTLLIDEAGKKRELWTDGFGRTIEADEPDSTGVLTSNTCYSYDSVGNLLQVIHGNQTRTFTYNALSRLTSATRPESGTVCYGTYASGVCQGNGYDSNSNVITETVPAPNQTGTTTVAITFSYDALNRLTKKTYSDGSPTIQYGYDGTAPSGCSPAPPSLTDSNAKGRMTSMCDGSGATSWAHDSMGRIITEKRTILGITQTISYSYNFDGSVATVTYPSGKTVTYTVSNAQRLTAAKDVTNNVQFAISAGYAPPGGLTGMITGQISGGFGGITESHTYNNSSEYTSTKATSTTGTAMDLTLSYALSGGDNGTLTGVTNNADSGRTQSFTYDPLNRILSAKSSATSGTDCWGQNFGPDGVVADDAVANLTKINSGTQTPPPCTFALLNATVDANNHINTDSTYAYDAAGNMTKDGSGTGYLYTFDDDAHLTLAAGPTGGPYCYVYDGNGLRVAKKSGATTCSSGTVTKLYWRSIYGDALAETDGTGSTANSAYNEYIFFAGRRIASRTGTGAIYYYFADQLGSTRTVTTGSGPGQTPGQLCYDADFTPYGQEISYTARLQTTACPPSYKFTGYERDPETGLDYAFARYYSSRLGRFLSTDPLGGAIGDLQSHNAYAYTVNNPLNLIDPSGMSHCHARGHLFAPNPCEPMDLFCTFDSCAPGDLGWWDEFDLLEFAFTPTFSGDFYVFGDPSGEVNVTLYGNWDLLSLIGGPSGPGGTLGPFVKTKVLAGCIQKLFGVTMTKFVESSQGSNGSFEGWGADTFGNGGNDASITVTNDVNTYSGQGLKALRDSRGNPPLPPGTVALAGLTLSDSPYTNFTANNMSELSQPASMIAETQVHELGNSLHFITGAAFNPATVPESDKDAGQLLEDCVRKRRGF